MEHTFLFEEAVWEAEGTYLPAEGPALSARGRTEITHADDVWINDGRLVMGEGESRRELRSTYRIRPFPAGVRSTSWTSQNPALGELRGTFAVVGGSTARPTARRWDRNRCGAWTPAPTRTGASCGSRTAGSRRGRCV